MGKELAEKKKALGGALLLNKSDSRECKLVCKGNDSSHRGSYTDADSDDREFAIHPVPDTDANTKSSQLVGKIDAGRLSYVNEYDVQNWTHAALEDAVTICNALLSTDGPAHESIKLDLRRESHLDSNLLDHAVVYEEMSGLPIFEAETKEPVNVPLNHTSLGSVKGQVNTQLSAMTAFGHPNPFGALTTFNETRIVWIENDNTESVLSHRGNSLEDLVRAVQLDDIHTPVAEKLIQSPVKIAPTETALTKTQQTDAAREEEKRDDSDGAKRRSRRVKNTTGYAFEESSPCCHVAAPADAYTFKTQTMLENDDGDIVELVVAVSQRIHLPLFLGPLNAKVVEHLPSPSFVDFANPSNEGDTFDVPLANSDIKRIAMSQNVSMVGLDSFTIQDDTAQVLATLYDVDLLFRSCRQESQGANVIFSRPLPPGATKAFKVKFQLPCHPIIKDVVDGIKTLKSGIVENSGT